MKFMRQLFTVMVFINDVVSSYAVENIYTCSCSGIIAWDIDSQVHSSQLLPAIVSLDLYPYYKSS